VVVANADPPALKDDILEGAQAISDFTGIKLRRIYHYICTGELPVDRLGRSIVARKSVLSQIGLKKSA
jgi:hypothetical protein